MTYALAFAASFSFVFLKSWQQLNVVHKKYWWITPTSLLMSTMELYIVVTAAKSGFQWLLVCAIGVGAGLGATLATWLHHKYITKGD